MTIKTLATEIAKREGKKSQARIGEVREILGLLSDFFYENSTELSTVLYNNGFKRSRKAKKRG